MIARFASRLSGIAAVLVVSGCAGQMGRGAGSGSGTQNEVISPPVSPVACLGADKGSPILAGPSTDSPVLGYTGEQVASDGYVYRGFGRVLFQTNRPGWVWGLSIHDFARPGFATVRCLVAGVHPDGTPVFLYH